MSPFRVDFDSLPWQQGLPGTRFKVHRDNGRQLRLLEFSADFVEPDWCQRGHIGILLEGSLEIDFHGALVRYAQGDGLFIPGGDASAHKARALTPIARLLLVEDA